MGERAQSHGVMPTAAASSEVLEAFRQEVGSFLADQLPRDIVARNRGRVHPLPEDLRAWMAILALKGWSVPSWPVEHGGTGWPREQRDIFEEELLAAGAPQYNIQGICLIAPLIYTFGTDAQKSRYLPAIRTGREIWGQGFSEPGSGSDLASLTTRAAREGDEWVINGQKIWTSDANIADHLFCLVRTTPGSSRHAGLSMLLVPTTSPGLEIRPIETIDGSISLNQVFFDDVRVGADHLIGEEGRGWDHARFILGHERNSVAELPRSRFQLRKLKALCARHRGAAGVAAIADPLWLGQIAEIEVELAAVEAMAARGAAQPTIDMAAASGLKVVGCSLLQRILHLQMEVIGPRATMLYRPDHADADMPEPDVAAEYLFRRAATIYGGTNEIQKNIIARAMQRGEASEATDDDDDCALLRESVTGYLRQHGGDRGQAIGWNDFVEQGWLGAGLPEAAGGYGGTPSQQLVIAECLGAALVRQAYIGSGVLPATLLERLGGFDTLLADIVSGRRVLAVAHDEPEAGGRMDAPGTQVRARDGGVGLDGAKTAVLGGVDADALIVSARHAGAANTDDGLVLLLVERSTPGVEVRARALMDGQRVADVRFRNAAVSADRLLSEGAPARQALAWAEARARLALCADALGAMGQVERITLEYLEARTQFGASLITFQALQHRLAEMHIEHDLSRALLGAARRALDAGDEAAAMRLSHACKARIGRAAHFVGANGLQLHGAMGMTEECSVGAYFKRLQVMTLLFGSASYHAGLYAQGDGGRKVASGEAI